MKINKFLIFFIFNAYSNFMGFSQEIPPILKFSPAVYEAGNQNWMISQDKKNHVVYFANNEGLLEYNGANWTLNPSPNETIIRSVNAINSRIYTGCYMEFGFWIRNKFGKLNYTSLSQKIKKSILDDEQFWNILNIDQWIIFQSLNRLYIYDHKTGKIAIIQPKNNIIKSFKSNNSIYFQVENEGLFEIENGKSKLVSDNEVLKKDKIVALFSNDNGLVIQTQSSGFYTHNNNELQKNILLSSIDLNHTSIYSSCLLHDGRLAIGTISNGIYIISSSGKIEYNIMQSQGLSNNTALSLYEDDDDNLWIGLDNGINCINLQTPVKNFLDETGILGTVYASILFNEKLYVGTNQGLFCKDFNSTNKFRFISGTKGQVWSLFANDGYLFCGHNSGTFIIIDEIAKNIFSQSGTWLIQKTENKNLLLQGNYSGISVLEKINNQWIFRNKITGFDYSSRYFEIYKNNEIYVSHEYKGVFKIKIDNNYQKAINVNTLPSPTKGKNASLIKYNNAILYANKNGVFRLNSTKKTFEKDNKLSAIFDKNEYTSGKMIVDNSNKIWLFSKNYIHYFMLNKLNYELKQNTIPIPSSLTNSMLGYENISQISNSRYLIGTTDGYYILDLNNLSFKNYNVSISEISVNIQNQKPINYSISEDGFLNHNQNNITFNFTVPVFKKYIKAEYQYRLQGLQDFWSQWSTKSSVNFKNLSPGDYTFAVKTKIGNTNTENKVQYNFIIKKPWYSTNLALLIYLIGFLFFGNFINKRYKLYYQKQQQKLIEENNLLLEIKELESEQQLMKLRNEQLSLDVDAKNKELAVSTMSLINKDELLSIIKEDLKKTPEENSSRSIKSVISTITKNISQDDTWNTFKEAFDNVDKDFLKKLKVVHTTLTPNDLRLCAYLRLNLSSKEIAPLISISVRSVEIKRYRLRKKMDLSHEQGLVEYILSV